MSIKSRISKLEKKKANQTKPAWVIVKDGDPIPEGMEGVKIYEGISPDDWDQDTKSEVKNGKDN
jgi:hypothetical protein